MEGTFAEKMDSQSQIISYRKSLETKNAEKNPLSLLFLNSKKSFISVEQNANLKLIRGPE